MIVIFLFALLMSGYIASRVPCDSSTDISLLGNRLCHYSSANGGYSTNTWTDISGNGHDLINEVDMFGLSYYGNNEDYVRNTQSSGYIKFPTACNLPANGDYTLFTASMYYGQAPIGSRAFGNCADNTFISGWYQPDYASGNHPNYPMYVKRGNYVLHTEKYDVNGWIIVSDTMNSFRINGAEITHQIPVFSNLGNADIQICFNYVGDQPTNAPYRIKEYIVFDTKLDDDDRRCVEEYIFDKHTFWQHLTGLAPYVASTDSDSTTDETDSCISDNEDDGYNNCGTWRYNGGCQEHFNSLIFQDKTGTMSFNDCCSKCKENSNCKSFSFGKRGVVRENWCNQYSVVCTDNGDLDWNIFTPDSNIANFIGLPNSKGMCTQDIAPQIPSIPNPNQPQNNYYYPQNPSKWTLSLSTSQLFVCIAVFAVTLICSVYSIIYMISIRKKPTTRYYNVKQVDSEYDINSL